MINLRSLVLVEAELAKVGLRTVDIGMGEADIQENPTVAQEVQLRIALRQSGLELLQDKSEILIHRIKHTIRDMVCSGEVQVENLSVYLSNRIGYDYTYMSNIFSAVMHTTIEKFYICHKIERVKHLLLYEGVTLIEIARKMGYCSSSHLSSQFKKITGRTPSQFKLEYRDRHPERITCG
jgi:AraC-like DNA-binding protein